MGRSGRGGGKATWGIRDVLAASDVAAYSGLRRRMGNRKKGGRSSKNIRSLRQSGTIRFLFLGWVPVVI